MSLLTTLSQYCTFLGWMETLVTPPGKSTTAESQNNENLKWIINSIQFKFINDITYIKVQFCQQVAKSVKVDGVQEIQKSLIVKTYI